MKARKSKILTSAAIIVSTLCLSACSGLTGEPSVYEGTIMESPVRIEIYDSDKGDLLDGCVELATSLEEKLSYLSENSEIALINEANGAPVEVSDDTVRLLEKGIYYGEMSDGLFDITIGSLSSLWSIGTEDQKIPSQEHITEAIRHINYRKIKITGNTVQLQDKQALLDVGAIEKGYIADQIKAYLKSEGVNHALINYAGHVLALGGKLDGSSFHAGVRKPFTDKEEASIVSVPINDKAVSTSGLDGRYMLHDGKIYHHILNPYTGIPINNSLYSVTIITDSCLTADALATTCLLMGPERGMRLVNQLENVEAVFIDDRNKVTYSRNYGK